MLGKVVYQKRSPLIQIPSIIYTRETKPPHHHWPLTSSWFLIGSADQCTADLEAGLPHLIFSNPVRKVQLFLIFWMRTLRLQTSQLV
jgi:hypothetical protein